MTGTRVAAAVTLILVATAVLPPATAFAVNRRRVTRATSDVSALAGRLAGRAPNLRGMAIGADVACGPGRMPAAEGPDRERWLGARRADLAAMVRGSVLTTDPWGNCYLVNLEPAAGAQPAVWWVVSAGPNGILETPFGAPKGPGGDDVGAMIPAAR